MQYPLIHTVQITYENTLFPMRGGPIGSIENLPSWAPEPIHQAGSIGEDAIAANAAKLLWGKKTWLCSSNRLNHLYASTGIGLRLEMVRNLVLQWAFSMKFARMVHFSDVVPFACPAKLYQTM